MLTRAEPTRAVQTGRTPTGRMERTRRDLLATSAATLTAAGSVGVAGVSTSPRATTARRAPRGPRDPDLRGRLVRPADSPLRRTGRGTIVDAAGTRSNWRRRGTPRRTASRCGSCSATPATSRRRSSATRLLAPARDGRGWLDIRGSPAGEAVELPQTRRRSTRAARTSGRSTSKRRRSRRRSPIGIWRCARRSGPVRTGSSTGDPDGPPLGAKFKLVG